MAEAKRDFPLYREMPGLSVAGWLFVLAAGFAGYLALFAPIPGTVGGFAKALLYSVIPLTALAMVAGAGWRSLFDRVRISDIALMLGFAILNLLVTGVIGYLVVKVHGGVANPLNAELAASSTTGLLLELARAAVQLVGEEIMTILPFLAILTLCVRAWSWSRRSAILAGWIGSSLLFGAAHLPTYGWEVAQCFVVIGAARIVLTIPYLITRNLWVSYGAHLINDVALFATPLALSALHVP